MKNNIDLTQEKMFSGGKYNKVFNNIINILTKQIFKDKKENIFPWSTNNRFVNINDDLIYKEYNNNINELILTGSKEDRKSKIKNLSYTSGNYCDCCGKDLRTTPWSNYFLLCDACSNSMSYINNIEGQLWKYRILNPWDETIDRVIVEMNKRK